MSTVGTFANRVAVLMGGAAFGQAFLLIVSPIVSRIYTPDQFGAFGVYLAFVAMISVVASFRLEIAIPLQANRRDATLLLRACIFLVVIVSLISAAAIWTFSEKLNRHFGLPFSYYLPIGVPLGILALGIFNAYSFESIKEHEYGRLSSAKAIYGVVAGCVQVALGIMGTVALVASDVVSRVVATYYLAKSHWKVRSPKRQRLDLKRTLVLLRRHRRYPLIAGPSSALNAAGVHAPTVLMAAFYGPGAAGALIFMSRVIGAPAGLLSQAVSRVYIGEVSERLRSGQNGIERLVLLTASSLGAIGVIPFALVMFFAPAVFSFVFGEQWREAGEIAGAMAPMLFLQFLTVPVSQTLNLVQEQTYQFVWDVVRLLSVLGVFMYSNAQDIPTLSMVRILSTVLSILYVALLILNWRVAAVRGKKGTE